MEKQTKKMNRREFLGLSALGLASFTILPSWSVNGQKYAPSDRIVFGFIGLGRQGMSDFYAAFYEASYRVAKENRLESPL